MTDTVQPRPETRPVSASSSSRRHRMVSPWRALFSFAQYRGGLQDKFNHP